MCAAASPADGRVAGAIEAKIELNGQTIDLSVTMGHYDAKMTPDVEDPKFSMENEGNHDHGDLPPLQRNDYEEVKQSLREMQRRINDTLSQHIEREEGTEPAKKTERSAALSEVPPGDAEAAKRGRKE